MDSRIRIDFTSNKEEIPGILNECLEHIRQKTQSAPPNEGTLSKIKWVVTEMLTNAIKHSGEEHCMLAVKVSDNRLILEKEDQGKPLSLTEQYTGKSTEWPISDLSEPLEFQIYHNGIDSLIVRADDPNRAGFFIEQLEDTAMPDLIQDTSEHFGLMIMAKSADAFSYEYDQDSHTNRFTCVFQLH